MNYKLYDVSPSGQKMDTGNVLSLASHNEAVAAVFKLYGFTQYAESYRLRPVGNDVFITYQSLDTWCLERVVE